MHWKKIYLFGGCAALIAFCGTLFDIIFGSVTTGSLSELPQTAIERFHEFQGNWFLGLYHLDLLNAIIALIMIPVFFALFAIHQRRDIAFSGLALTICYVGTIIFVTTNTALPMMELSEKYFLATEESQKTLIAAAGEALLVRGEHGSPGVFLGFLISTLGSVSMAILMLKGKVFKKTVSWFGILGHSSLLVYIILVTFIPEIQNIAVAVAAPGGIMALLWVLLIGIQLIKFGTTSDT